MTVIQKRFDIYRIDYYSVSQGIPRHSIPIVTIRVLPQFGDQVGIIEFTDERRVRANFIDNNDNIVIHYHINRFNDIMNILQHRISMYIYIDDTDFTGGILTDPISVGPAH